MVDVYELTNLLRQLNFQVVSLLDLTESEMRNAVDEFLLLLHKGVYGMLRLVPDKTPSPKHDSCHFRFDKGMI